MGFLFFVPLQPHPHPFGLAICTSWFELYFRNIYGAPNMKVWKWLMKVVEAAEAFDMAYMYGAK